MLYQELKLNTVAGQSFWKRTPPPLAPQSRCDGNYGANGGLKEEAIILWQEAKELNLIFNSIIKSFKENKVKNSRY